MSDPVVASWLTAATSIQVEDKWYPVLGYELFDDIMCLENHSGQDITIVDASEFITHDEIKVEVNVQRMLDIMFD